jgi:hypothetical protein
MMPGDMECNNNLRSLFCVALGVPLSPSTAWDWATPEQVIAGTRAALIAEPSVFGPKVLPEIRANEEACEELLDRLIARMNKLPEVIRTRERALRRWRRFLKT